MEIHEQRHGAVTVIKPDGALQGDDADRVATHVRDALEKAMGRIVFDAGKVPFVDSKGLECLLGLSEEAELGGQSFRLCNANETVREVLELTGLADRFEHFDDVTSAVRSFL